MRTIKNVDYQVMVDLVQLARQYPEGIPHDAARAALGAHLGGRSVTHLVQRLQAEGIVQTPPVKASRVPKSAAEAATQLALPVDVQDAVAQPGAPSEDPTAPPAEDAPAASAEPDATPAEGAV